MYKIKCNKMPYISNYDKKYLQNPKNESFASEIKVSLKIKVSLRHTMYIRTQNINEIKQMQFTWSFIYCSLLFLV